MKVVKTEIEGVLILEPRVFADQRGYFFETYLQGRYEQLGIAEPFVQDNLSRSEAGTLRGLHFQEPGGQGKLVQVFEGCVFDVAVDVRKGSPSFGRHVAVELSSDNHLQLWIPPGFAHGFCVLSPSATFFYKCTRSYQPDAERSIVWNDPALGIRWPIERPRLSAKDAQAPLLSQALTLPVFSLPTSVAIAADMHSKPITKK